MLIEQSKALRERIEILVFDDRSTTFFKKRNSLLSKFDQVSYLEFEANLGRSRIRNRLADFSAGTHILFIDCDMIPSGQSYLMHFVEQMGKVPVVCGGIGYGPKPFKQELLLRWKFGVRREMKRASSRQAHPYRNFTSGNFMIAKEVFNHIRFNEDILGYGQEDTLFSLELKRRGVPVLHIDNTTIHLGIEPNFEFLAKSEQSIVNLVKLLSIAPHMRRELNSNVRVLQFYRVLRFFGLSIPLRWFFRVFNPMLRRVLCSTLPSLVLFDLYKVGLIATTYRKPQ